MSSRKNWKTFLRITRANPLQQFSSPEDTENIEVQNNSLKHSQQRQCDGGISVSENFTHNHTQRKNERCVENEGSARDRIVKFADLKTKQLENDILKLPEMRQQLDDVKRKRSDLRHRWQIRDRNAHDRRIQQLEMRIADIETQSNVLEFERDARLAVTTVSKSQKFETPRTSSSVNQNQKEQNHDDQTQHLNDHKSSAGSNNRRRKTPHTQRKMVTAAHMQILERCSSQKNTTVCHQGRDKAIDDAPSVPPHSSIFHSGGKTNVF